MAELVTLPGTRGIAESQPGQPAREQQRGNGGAMPEPTQGPDLRSFLNVLKRRRAIVFWTAALLTALAIAIVFQLAPRYTAEAIVLLETRKTNVVDIQAVVSGLQSDTAAVRSELEVLQSPTLAGEVADKLDLRTNRLFNPSLRKPTLWERFNPLPMASQLISDLWSDPNVASIDPTQPQQHSPADAAIDTLLSGLSIVNDGRSYAIKVRFSSENPAIAALVANTYVELYLRDQLEAKLSATRQATRWLNDQLADLRDKVRDSERAVQLFKEQNKLTETRGLTVTSQQLSEINSQLIIAASDRAQKEANLRQIQDMKSSGGADAAAQVLASPLIQQLKVQETELLRKEAEFASRYRAAHPAMINIHAEVKDIQKKIESEVNKVVRGTVSDVNAARAREASLRSSLQELQRSTGQQNKAEVQMRELEREAAANRTLYENFLGRFKQTSAQEDAQQPDGRLIAEAKAPTVPTFPRKGLFIGLSGALALLMGLMVAFVVERLDNGFRHSGQIERLAGISGLGLVPSVGGRRRPHDIVIDQPVSSYAEAIRSVRTALRFTNVDRPPKVVLVTSSVMGEGKTVFAVSLARSAAFSRSRAILVDCDLRRPAVGRMLAAADAPGLISLFEQGGDFSQLVEIDEASGLHYIPVGNFPSNPQDLLGSQTMRTLLDALRQHYDLIVLDAPPLLAVSDALVLSHLADASIFIIRWGKTPRQIALGALKLLRSQGGGTVGAVLSRVNVRKHARYGFGDHGYYYGHYGSYYTKVSARRRKLVKKTAKA